MFKKRFSFVGLLITFILTSTAFIGGIAYFGKAYLGDWSALAQIARTRSLIESKYVGDVDGKNLSVGSVKGMVRELKDPYSYYLDANALAELSNEFEGHFGGIGIVMGKLEKQFVVVATVEDTPAYRAGIKSGDVILAVDNNDTVGEDLETIVKQVRGEDGTAVELKIQTGKENPRIVRVVRSDIKLPSVRGKMLDKRIGYIRIRTFNQETGKDFGKTYRELVNQGMEGLVLDLRSNPFIQLC
jgi:carboxyl-terminal processing protease